MSLPGILMMLRLGGAAAQTLPTQSPGGKQDSDSTVATQSAVSSQFQEALLLVDVNRQHLGQTTLMLIAKDGTPWVAQDDLIRWRLNIPATRPHLFRGKRYFPLTSVRGVSYTINKATQSITITARPEAFAGNVFNAPRPQYSGATLPTAPGGFLNYDLSLSHYSGLTQRSGLFEAGYFDRRGVLIGNFLANDLGNQTQLTRLDTSWEHDDPARMTSLRLGDEINQAGTWGIPVRFGGIQYGTNFATNPGFIAFPLATASGQAALPSTVDVFVNNALVAQQKVPPGPFSITNIPTVTGAGNVQLVVTDLLGRQQVITQPFYASPVLLKKGLEDYSYELGFERDNFGISSNDYGHALASATYRKGFSNDFTGEVHGELMRDQQTLGATANYRWGDIGVLSGSFAASRSDTGDGSLTAVGFQRLTDRWNFSARTQWTTTQFRQIGLTEDQLPPRELSSLNVGYSFGRVGSVSAAYVRQRFRDQPSLQVGSLNYSVALGKYGFLGVSAIKTYGDGGNLSFFTTLTIPLGAQTSAGIQVHNVRQSGDNTGDTTYTLQHSLPPGEGFGYHLLARDHDELQAGASYQNNIGTYTAEVDQLTGQTAERIGISGGIGMIGGHPFLARRLTDSFGLVEVPGYANVRVLQDNQVVGRTDADGYAVLPDLRAYDRNPISIDQKDLPLDAKVDSLTLTAVPYYRSGVLLKFPVTHARGALLHIRLDDGAELPVGATVQTASGEAFPVAYHGEAYVTGLASHNHLIATWHGQRCEIDVAYPPTKDPLPDLGTFLCKGIKR
jgi:outer membrane usher protein